MDISQLLGFLASSVIGGIVGGWISFRFYIAQKKFDFKQKDDSEKREALREMHPMLHIIYRDISLNWELPEDSKETSKEHIASIVDKISYWRTLFVSDNDVLKIIREIDALVGVSKDWFYGPDKANIKKPGQTVSDLRDAITTKIKEYDKSLSGRR